MILFLFIFMSTISKADFVVYYMNDFSIQSQDDKGGLALAKNKIRELSKTFKESLFVLCPSIDNIDNMNKLEAEINILSQSEISGILPKESYIDNLDLLFSKRLSIPYVVCNLYKKENITRYNFGYRNVVKDNMKISVIGLMKKRALQTKKLKDIGKLKKEEEERLKKLDYLELELRDEFKNLIETLKLLSTNFNPNVSLLLTDYEFNESELKQLSKFNIILIPTYPMENDNIIVAKPTQQNELGMLQLTVTNKEITDYKNSLIELKLKNKEYEEQEKELQKQVEQLKKEGKSVDADKLQKNIDSALDKAVEEYKFNPLN